MINVTFTNESVTELQGEMRQLLDGVYQGERIAPPTAADVAKLEGPGGAQEARRPSGRTRQTAAEKAAEKQGIQSGEERKDPADTEADQKQDAKDEAAETAAAAAKAAAAKPADPVKLTHDDVRALLSGYVMAYGMEAAQADCVAFLGGAEAVSKIADTQPALATAILGIAKGIETNPKNRDMNGDGLTGEKIAQLKPIIVAAKAVTA